MKKMKGILSMLLVMVLLFTAVPAGSTAYADGPVLSIMNYVHDGEDYGLPVDNEVTTDLDESKLVSVTTGEGENIKDVADMPVVTLRQGIKITPAEGYVIEEVLFLKPDTQDIAGILAQPDVIPDGEEEPAVLKNSAMPFATANKADASVSFLREDIVTGEGENESIKAELFTGGLSASDNCAIVVVLKALSDTKIDLSFKAGELELQAALVDGGSENNNIFTGVPAGTNTVLGISEAADLESKEKLKVFKDWTVEFENGMTGFNAAADEKIFIAADASFTANWEDYTPPVDPGQGGEETPVTVDLTVTAKDPVFDAENNCYVRSNDAVEVSANPAEGDSFNGVTVEVKDNGDTVTLTPSNLQVIVAGSDPAAASSNTYNVTYVAKTYTKPALTVTAANPAETATGSKTDPVSGTDYTLTGTLAEGEKISVTITYDTSDASKVVAKPGAVITDANGRNVTNKYFISYVNGETEKQVEATKKTVTVTANAPVFDAESNSYKAAGYTLSGDAIDAAHTLNDSAIEYAVSEVSADGKIKVTPSLKEGAKLITEGENDVTESNYTVNFAASADYTLPALTVTAVNPAETATGSKTGVANTDYVLSGTLAQGETAAVTITYDTSDESKVVAKASAVITDANSKTVTNKYFISYADGVTAKTPVTTVKLVIKAKDRTAEYTGETVTANDYEIKSGKLNTGDKITEIKYDGGSKKVTESAVDSTPHSVVIKNGETDVTANYEIEYEAGKVTVTKYSGEVTISAADAEKVYDGTALTKNEVSATGLRTGDYVVATAEGSATIPGDTGANKVVDEGENKWVIKNADGEDVSGCYAKVTLEDGKLTVKKRPVTITAKDKTVTYTGEAVTIVGSDIGYENFVLDHVPNVAVRIMQKGEQVSSAVESGSYTVEIYSYTVKDGDGKGSDKDSKGNSYNDFYDVTVNNGTLLIKPTDSSYVLTVTAPSKTWTYDGTEHKSQDLDDVKIDGLQDGDYVAEVKFTSTSKITNAGKAANIIDTVVIKDKDHNAVSNSKYVVNRKAGELVVNKYAITVTAKSATKDYDGTSSTNNKDVVVPKQLANANHKVTSARVSFLDANGKVVEPVNAGTYTKKVTEVTIKDGNTDVTANYAITYVDGTLTINAKAGTGTGTGTGGGVKTGDESNIIIWIVLLAVSAVVAGVVLVILLKKTRKQPEPDMPEAAGVEESESEEQAEDEIVIDQSVFDDGDK